MRFIGQDMIMAQLGHLLPHLYETKEGVNILLKARSGLGKTRMGLMICNYLSDPQGNFDYSIADSPVISPSRRVHFIDEIHLLENPETLYPLMDSKKDVLIFATNGVSPLKEAFSNRCDLQFVFEDYKKDDLRDIARSCTDLDLKLEFCDYIIEFCGENPRIIKSFLYKFNILCKRGSVDLKSMSMEKFKILLRTVYGIRDGLDVQCQQYLDILSSLGGRASLDSISNLMHLDTGSIRYQIEPVLMSKGLLNITSRGRSLINAKEEK